MTPREAGRWDAVRLLAKPAELPEVPAALRGHLAPRPPTADKASRRLLVRPRSMRRYVWSAVKREFDSVATTPEGQRNDRLNKAAFCLGQLVAADVLEEQDAHDALALAAEVCGLPSVEAEKTIASGLRSGMQQPRQLRRRRP